MKEGHVSLECDFLCTWSFGNHLLSCSFWQGKDLVIDDSVCWENKSHRQWYCASSLFAILESYLILSTCCKIEIRQTATAPERCTTVRQCVEYEVDRCISALLWHRENWRIYGSLTSLGDGLSRGQDRVKLTRLKFKLTMKNRGKTMSDPWVEGDRQV